MFPASAGLALLALATNCGQSDCFFLQPRRRLCLTLDVMHRCPMIFQFVQGGLNFSCRPERAEDHAVKQLSGGETS